MAAAKSPAASPFPGERSTAQIKTQSIVELDPAQIPRSRGNSPTMNEPGAAANPLSRKLDKFLGMRLDQDKEVLEALYALSEFYNENTLTSRRNLRTEVEKRVLDVSHEYLDSFSLVKQRLDEVQAEIAAMATSCAQMKGRLQAARSQTAGVVDRTNELQARAQKLTIWAEAANAFVHKFQLTPEQLTALRGVAGDGAAKSRSQSYAADDNHANGNVSVEQVPLDDAFFEALARAKQIHTDCQLLVVTNHQMIGLEIMDQMAQLQESSYQRMYRWALQECRVLSKGVMDVPLTLRRALHALRDRPELFRYCYDEVSATRKAAVSRDFIDALAIGGPGGFPRPIEMHSHDPIRYVSDMLAWLHQCVAAEQELLINLFTLPKQHAPVRRYRSNLRQPLERRFSRADVADAAEQSQKTSEEEERHALEEAKTALSGIMDGTCRPFKSRLDQVLSSDQGVVICFQLFNLLRFYSDTIGSHLSPDYALTGTLHEGWHACFKVFMDVLNNHGQKLLAESSKPPPADLSPSLIHMQTLILLKDIVASYSGSLATPSWESAPEADDMSISRVLDALLDPLLQAAQHSCARLSTANRAVYMLNCLTSIQSTLGLYEWAADKFERLETQLDEHLNDLVHAQTSYTLSRTGLAEKLAILNKVQSEHIMTPLSEMPGMSPSAVRDTMLEFDNFLSMATNRLAMPQCDLLSSARLRKKVRQQAVELVGSAYASFYTAILDPGNNYPDPSDIVPRTPEQVRTLLA